ncbi:MAG: carbohydrate-binding domain-containing protein [Bacteroidaceae bacterium]|nr:carbohydrate-binding domain-containing protein [Bacteroidaceae bacterium]
MKKVGTLLTAFWLTIAAMGQTLNVQVGSVTYQFPAEQTGEMIYTNGTELTVMGRTFTLADIDAMTVGENEVKDNTVSVNYDGETATILVAGNVAQYVEATVSGAHVSIEQTNTDAIDGDEITYSLSGASSNGSLTLGGSYKCTVQLAGLTLTNPNGAVIEINNKKRIQLSVKKDTENSLSDGANGSQKACLYSKGQLQMQGNGLLTVTGNTTHAIKGGDYITMKNLTLVIPSAVDDGINCNKYFQMNSGNVSIMSVGDDGIQVDLESDDDTTAETDGHKNENSGNLYVEDGTLTITIPAAAAGGKCLKATGLARISGGDLSLTVSGRVDTSDSSDPSYAMAIKGTNVTIAGGNTTIKVTGAAGRGLSADDTITTDGGTLVITNSGAPTTISSDVKSAKGLNALNIALNAGDITINMSSNASKAISCGDGTKTTSGGGGGPWGGMGGSTKWTNVKGSFTMGLSDGTGPKLTISQTGSTYNSSSAKAIKAICAVTIYGGETDIYTKSSGGEGLESKTSIDIRGGHHYFKCYDDCINSAGKIFFNGGITVCYSNGNDAVDSNAGTTGAITIGNGIAFAYTSKGSPEEGFDCDNNSYIQITGTGIGISAGGNQGGGGGGGPWGGGGGSSSGSTISNAKQGYAFVTSSISYQAKRYYTLADASGNNLVTYSFVAACSSNLALFTATGMVKNEKYTIKYSTEEPTDATTVWHGLYLGSTHQGTTNVTSFTAK